MKGEATPSSLTSDGRSVVRFVAGRWCPPGADDEDCNPPTSGGRTHLWPRGGSVGFAVTDDGASQGPK